ncbi:MAG: alpha/beta hydrolase [Lentisphaerae bacterium]|jgi:acetyl esterase/lipase|nr:alpha/beta hydrolase [Lentisphaerota bacterium]MBT4818275.1 alpha/beta hydrolase [Lentisphaerota bacterium]MBT5605732.1 alpha/beta hydrolase [Lentisphaerota bacterium]MBT7061962.1 alpha/beta hydrolase [Lentisphaerota bacterium]MBT7842557.1 alpha/beta hydrolase [Lentisphaerota bacterium]
MTFSSRLSVAAFASGSLLACSCLAGESTVMPLWPDGAPGATGSGEDHEPTLTVFLPAPDKATGAAIVICPGGGYGGLATGHEGTDVAAWLNRVGVAGLMLKYRLPAKGYRHPHPLKDAQRAMRLVRHSAASWGIDPGRIGIMGFSAGGHLASTAGTHFDAGDAGATDPINCQSCRPDFMILGYPVITMQPGFVHQGSRNNLLGPKPDPALIESLSNERQVTAETPPTFLHHASDDGGVVPRNSIEFYSALLKAKVPAELHMYEHGGHGYGAERTGSIAARNWQGACEKWLEARGLLK